MTIGVVTVATGGVMKGNCVVETGNVTTGAVIETAETISVIMDPIHVVGKMSVVDAMRIVHFGMVEEVPETETIATIETNLCRTVCVTWLTTTIATSTIVVMTAVIAVYRRGVTVNHRWVEISKAISWIKALAIYDQ